MLITPQKKCFFLLNFFRCIISEWFLQILYQHKILNFFTPILTYFEKKNLSLIEVAFCTLLTRKYEIRITKDENRKIVFSILVLGSQVLSKNSWTMWNFQFNRSRSLHPTAHGSKRPAAQQDSKRSVNACEGGRLGRRKKNYALSPRPTVPQQSRGSNDSNSSSGGSCNSSSSRSPACERRKQQ